jgi:hypothetical protein
MKKILAPVSLLCLLIFAAICTAEPPTNVGTNSNAKTAGSKSSVPSEADLIAKDKAVWEALKKKDYGAFGNMLASDYIEVTDEGVFDKAGIIANVRDLNLTDATFSDWKVWPVDNRFAIVRYETTIKATYKGADIPPGPYHSASVWVNRDGKWLAFYYQQTPVLPAPPATSPRASKLDKAPASAAARRGETGPDPIANEKIIWETFKSKDHDAFAALLDPAFVEIEAGGVYDKAGAVKSVEGFDVTNFELTDWKSARLDGDAALVTYLVKPRNPKFTQRHTTIWANRGGKWSALLHVGTPVAKSAVKPETKKM